MNIFVTADHHFSQQGVCNFLRDDGSPLRPWDRVEEMDEALVDNWNRTVGPNDKVYHLGDVALKKKHLRIIHRLNGDKVLLRGNHDTEKASVYLKYFRDVRAYHVMDRILFGHIPVHPSQKGRFRANVHGHTHYRRVLGDDGKPDLWYIPVSVEHTDYAPLPYEEILRRVALLDKP